MFYLLYFLELMILSDRFQLIVASLLILFVQQSAKALLPSANGMVFTPHLVWKYGWQDGNLANTLGSAKNRDPLPLGTTYLPTGYSPSDMSAAYGFDQIPAGGDGNNQTITIIDAFGSPNIQSDLDTFCSTNGIPSVQVNVIYPYGQPSTNDPTWAMETTLDVEWAHAMAPGAAINLIVTPSNDVTMYSAIQYATSRNAKIISMSWGTTNEYSTIVSDSARYITNPAVSYVASAGDHGFGVNWPAADANVLSVGGTQLKYDRASNTIVSETGWSWSHDSQGWWATGGGVSKYETKPSFQKYWTGYANRAVPDVGYNGDGYTPVQVFFTDPVTGTNGWYNVNGTSAGAPQWAALIACRASLGKTNATPINQQMYYLAGKPTNASYTKYFRDIVSGNNGFPASKGFDLMTGLGSPLANEIATNSPAAVPSAGPTPVPAPTPTPVIPNPPVLTQWGAVPAPIPSNAQGAPILAISCGAGNPSDSSVLTTDGQVIVWGSGSCTNVPTEASTRVSAISLGFTHMMALKNGGVLAWGDNTSGAIDIPTTVSNGIVAISAGWWSGLALTTNGTIAAWGNKYGTNITAYHSANVTIAFINSVASLNKVIGISDGYNQGMCLLDDGTVRAFGNSFTTANDAQSDIPIGLSGVIAISEGRDFALALKSDGTVVAWGDNSKGQCKVPHGLTGVIAIAAGGFHSLALKSDGTVVTWGDNSYRQTTVPLGLTGIKSVAAGRYHSMASLEGVGGSQTSGGRRSSSGVGKTPPPPRVAPAPRVGVGSKSGAVSGSKSGSTSVVSRSAPVPRAAPVPRK